jgi:hypothetical protein
MVSKLVKITRTSSTVGPVLSIHIPQQSLTAQVYQTLNKEGIPELFAWVTHIPSPTHAPRVSRVPYQGGVATQDELERLVLYAKDPTQRGNKKTEEEEYARALRELQNF